MALTLAPAGPVKIHDNVLNAGTGTDSASYGLIINASNIDAEIRNNTIWTRTNAANSAYGIELDFANDVGDVKLDNNSVSAIAASMGLAYGIYANGAGGSAPRRLVTPADHITSITNNAFWVAAPGSASLGVTNYHAAVGDLNGDVTSGTTRSGNIGGTSADNNTFTMGFVDEANRDFHLSSATPTSALIGVGVNGEAAGWDFGASGYVDLDATPRGAMWSIGAYQ